MTLQTDHGGAPGYDPNHETRVNVRFQGPLAQHVESKVDSAIYNSSSEYLRDLVRRDMEAEIAMHVEMLKNAGRQLAKGQYKPYNAEETRKRVRAYRAAEKGNGGK